MRPDILSSYQYLLQQFQEIRSEMSDPSKDQYNFPAIDLALNFQLLRTTKVLDNNPSDMDCALLMEELMSIISAVPLASIAQMGAPMIYQTLQICTMVCNSFEQNNFDVFSGPAATVMSKMSDFLSTVGKLYYAFTYTPCDELSPLRMSPFFHFQRLIHFNS